MSHNPIEHATAASDVLDFNPLLYMLLYFIDTWTLFLVTNNETTKIYLNSYNPLQQMSRYFNIYVLFDRLYQKQPTVKKFQPGTGVLEVKGLLLCYVPRPPQTALMNLQFTLNISYPILYLSWRKIHIHITLFKKRTSPTFIPK